MHVVYDVREDIPSCVCECGVGVKDLRCSSEWQENAFDYLLMKEKILATMAINPAFVFAMPINHTPRVCRLCACTVYLKALVHRVHALQALVSISIFCGVTMQKSLW